jgi:hypothetical protein
MPGNKLEQKLLQQHPHMCICRYTTEEWADADPVKNVIPAGWNDRPQWQQSNMMITATKRQGYAENRSERKKTMDLKKMLRCDYDDNDAGVNSRNNKNKVRVYKCQIEGSA